HREGHAAQGGEGLVRLQIADEAPVDQRRLERGELLLPRKAPVDLGDVDDVNRGCHWASTDKRNAKARRSRRTHEELTGGSPKRLREALRVLRVLRVSRGWPVILLRRSCLSVYRRRSSPQGTAPPRRRRGPGATSSGRGGRRGTG